MDTPSHETPHPLPTPPLIVVPATTMGVQPTQNYEGTPIVMMQLTNAVVHCNFPMDLDQARSHVEDVQRAILEAQSFQVPHQGLVRP
jgi:hypothetical protein